MNSFKINQIIEKATYPFLEQLGSVNEDKNKLSRQVLTLITPAFLSGVLTSTLFDDIISGITKNGSRFLWLETWWGTLIATLLIFSLLSLIVSIVSNLCYLTTRWDNKLTSTSRERLADYYYKSILPEVFVAISFLDKAGDNQQNDFSQVATDEADARTDLLYYQALFYLSNAKEMIVNSKLIEYGRQQRKGDSEFLALVNTKSLSDTFLICQVAADSIFMKTNAEEAKTLSSFFRTQQNSIKTAIRVP